ncbi:MAG: tetratricopeptide repeat protein [Bacteroidota bacterium]|nr:tetratricopeptide repeat protein [Bacteroidota bacterium]
MSQQLIQLIKTLTRSEKRYVNLNLRAFSFDEDSNKILSDFNKIEKQIGLKKIKSELSIEGNPTRLYYKILDILFQFHENELPNSDESLKNLKRAKLLIFKGFYHDGVKILNKITNQSANFDYLIKMEALELKLSSAIKFVDIKYLIEGYPADKLLFSKFHGEYFNLMEFQSIQAIIKLESSTLYFNDEEHQLTKEYKHLLEKESNAFHPLAKIYFNIANGFLSLKNKNLNNSYVYAKRALDLFDQYPNVKNKNTLTFLKSIRNFCLVLIHMHRYSDAEDFLKKIKPSLEVYKKYKTTDINTELFTLLVLLNLDIIISNNSIKVNLSLIKHFENEFKLNEDYLNDDEKASMHYNLSIFYLFLNNYRKALTHTIQSLKIAGLVRKDIYHLSLMNELTLHYFLGNTEVLLSKLLAYKRIISKGDIVFGFEKEMPASLDKIFNDPQNSSLYKKLFAKINLSLLEEKKEVYKPFIPLFCLKPL